MESCVLLATVSLPATAAVERVGAREESGHRVVLAGRNRIEFVVVAASAGDGQRHEASGRNLDLFSDDVHLEIRIVLSTRLRAEGQESGRDQQLIALLRVVGGQ
jgi:hypothetical protein